MTIFHIETDPRVLEITVDIIKGGQVAFCGRLSSPQVLAAARELEAAIEAELVLDYGRRLMDGYRPGIGEPL